MRPSQIEKFIYRKQEVAYKYNKGLSDLPLKLPVEKSWAKNVYWMYGIVLKESTGLDASNLTKILMDQGIETRPFFLGIHKQPVFQKMGLFEDVSLPTTERLSKQGIYLPSGQSITDEQVQIVIEALRNILS